MYKQLADWNKKKGDDLEILLFPSDEFGGQELPSEEIAPFLAGFKLTKDLPLDGTGGCRLMEKVKTNGDDASPVFKLGKEAFPGDVAWNFAGIFLFDGDGKCVGRYDTKGLKELGRRRDCVIARRSAAAPGGLRARADMMPTAISPLEPWRAGRGRRPKRVRPHLCSPDVHANVVEL